MDPKVNDRQCYPLTTAVAMIALGVLFLLRNLGVIDVGRRWWALFILIPVAYLFSFAWRGRQRNQGRFPPEARGSLVGGSVLVVVMLAFLFNMDWGKVWPLFLIIAGLGLLVGTRRYPPPRPAP